MMQVHDRSHRDDLTDRDFHSNQDHLFLLTRIRCARIERYEWQYK